MARSRWQLGQLPDVREAGRDKHGHSSSAFIHHISNHPSRIPFILLPASSLTTRGLIGSRSPFGRADVVVSSMFHWWQYKSLLAAACAFLVWLLGGWDVLAQALVLLIALDVAGGLAQAFYERKLNSSIMRRGLIRKTGYFAAIALAVLVDRALFQAQPAFRTLVLSYLCVNEALSVLEHLAAIGVPLPAQLKHALEKLRHDMDSDDQRQPAE
jgi:toxin secretion/phage lysis holin